PGQAQAVEGADEVDPDDELELVERVGLEVAVDGTYGHPQTGRVDQRPQGPEVAGRVHRHLDIGRAGHVGLDEQPAELVGQGLAQVFVEVDEDAAGAEEGERPGRGGADPGGAARDDGGCGGQVHVVR